MILLSLNSMKILIAYATNSGGTQMAASQVESHLTGHEVTSKQISEVTFDELNNFDVLIFATPSWFTNNQDGMPHDDWVAFIDANKDKKLAGKKFALFGLGDSSYDHFCGGIEHVEKFVDALGGVRIVDTLKIDGYYTNQTQSEQLINDWCVNLTQKLTAS